MGKQWGAYFTSMKYVYVVLIRSLIDYGGAVYGSAAKSALTVVDMIQAHTLRLCLGAVKASPVCPLQVGAGGEATVVEEETVGSKLLYQIKWSEEQSPQKRGSISELGGEEGSEGEFWVEG